MSPLNNPKDGHQPGLKAGACGKSLGVSGFQEKLCELKAGHEGPCGFLPTATSEEQKPAKTNEQKPEETTAA